MRGRPMSVSRMMAVSVVAVCSVGIWLVTTATLRYVLLPSGDATVGSVLRSAASPDVAIVWLLIAVLMAALLRIADVRDLKGALSAATPLAIGGMASAVGYHVYRNGVPYALALAILMVALVYGVAAAIFMTTAGEG